MTDREDAGQHTIQVDESALRRLKAAMKADARGGEVYVKSRDYTEFLDMNVRQVARLMEVADSRGWIEIWGKGRVYTWRLTLDSCSSDGVTAMTDRVDELEGRIDELERLTESLQGRIRELESHSADGTLDRYDATVLDGLEEGREYRLSDLQEAYRAAGIRQKSTLKQRIKHLTKTHFESTGNGIWRFAGGENNV